METKKKGNKTSSKALSIALQAFNLQANFPAFKVSIDQKGKRLVAEGDLQPSSASEVYRIRVLYSLDHGPTVYIIHPKLEKRDQDNIPHTYPGNRLCLYLPRSGEWTAGKFLSETIIPWITLWLYHYEVWHATGEWLGGGEHPSSGKKESD